jgi:hypothetical protein
MNPASTFSDNRPFAKACEGWATRLLFEETSVCPGFSLSPASPQVFPSSFPQSFPRKASRAQLLRRGENLGGQDRLLDFL